MEAKQIFQKNMEDISFLNLQSFEIEIFKSLVSQVCVCLCVCVCPSPSATPLSQTQCARLQKAAPVCQVPF